MTLLNNMIPEKLIKNAQEVIELIKHSHRILICSHMRPDGDAVGSLSGMLKSLQILGKDVEVALIDGIPERFAFVWPQQITLIKEPVIELSHDLVIILDSGDESRTGFTFKYDKSKTCMVNIDHHASNTYFGDINLVDIGASSTCEMVTALLCLAGFPFNNDVALGLILGLMTDSRCFQNEGIRYSAHVAAANLLKTGVDSSPILNMMNSGRNEADLRVLGFGMSNFNLHCQNRLATLVIKQSDLKRLKASTANVYASGVFNQCLSIQHVFASVVIFEREDGLTACEFRSRGGIDVKEVAVSMGGGGHVPASGCSREASIDVVAEEAICKTSDQVMKFFSEKEDV